MGTSCRRAVLSDQILHQRSGDHILLLSTLCPEIAPVKLPPYVGKVYKCNSPLKSTAPLAVMDRDWLHGPLPRLDGRLAKRQCKEETVLVLSSLSEPVTVAYISPPLGFRLPVSVAKASCVTGVITRRASAGRPRRRDGRRAAPAWW